GGAGAALAAEALGGTAAGSGGRRAPVSRRRGRPRLSRHRVGLRRLEPFRHLRQALRPPPGRAAGRGHARGDRGGGRPLVHDRLRHDLALVSSEIAAHVGVAPTAFAYPFGAYGGDRNNDASIQGILREEVAGRYAVAFQQDDQHTVPALTATDDHLLLRRIEV